MRLLPSTAASSPVTCAREKPLRVARRPTKHPRASPIALTCLVSSWIIAGYFAEELPAVAVLSSLVSGFAPLIGLGVLLIVVTLLISFLICTVERTLADEDDGIVSEEHRKSKWHRIVPSLPDKLAHCLSLKEHSPPAFLLS